MSDLVLLFDQVKLLSDPRILRESLLADVKQFLNRVLDSSLDLAFMQNGAELLKDGIDACWGRL